MMISFLIVIFIAFYKPTEALENDFGNHAQTNNNNNNNNKDYNNYSDDEIWMTFQNIIQQQTKNKAQQQHDYYYLFANPQHESDCQKMVQQLTIQQQEIAAQTSFAYWFLYTQQQQQQQKQPTLSSSLSLIENDINNSDNNDDSIDFIRFQMAMLEAKRHYDASNQNYKTALSRLIESCDYRIQYNLHDSLRSTHTNQTLQDLIISDLTKQPVLMRTTTTTTTSNEDDATGTYVSVPNGKNKNNVVFYKYPRREAGASKEAYIMTQLWLVEKALAVTEFQYYNQKQKQQQQQHRRHLPSSSPLLSPPQIIVVFDLHHPSSSSSSKSPPLSWQMSAISLVQQLYPERLGQLYIVHAPLWLRIMYQSLKPLLSSHTQQKIQVSSSLPISVSEIDLELIDIQYYVQDLPFYLPFD